MNASIRTRRYARSLFIGILLLTAVAAITAAQTGARDAETIGRSVEGRPITVERVGSGDIHILIVGGIHGAYEANSIALARRILSHVRSNPGELEGRFTLHVIDNMNPDGLFEVTGDTPLEEFDFRGADTVPGRFNARGVDLNRNWDADWKPTSCWGQRVVDAGSEPFSEPETRAVRDYFHRVDPAAGIFYQSAAAGIWYSGAEDQWEPARRLAQAYSRAGGYQMPDEDDGLVDYEITGSADDYFYQVGYPNLTVELTTHYGIEWEQNLPGFRAFLDAVLEGS